MQLTDEIREQIHKQLTARPETPVRPNVSRRLGSGAWAQPHASEALGVHPDQIEEATQQLRAHGVTADFDRQGRLLVTSDRQFRQAAKAFGMWDGRDGYQVKDVEGRPIRTGRESARARQEARARIRRIIED